MLKNKFSPDEEDENQKWAHMDIWEKKRRKKKEDQKKKEEKKKNNNWVQR